MFFRILRQSFARQRGRKALAAAAVIAGMTVTTAMLTIRLNVGDDLKQEVRRVGANILVQPAGDTLPVTLNGVDLRPADQGAFLQEKDLPAIKRTFWTNNITAIAPLLFVPATAQVGDRQSAVELEGTYFAHPMTLPGSGRVIRTGMRQLAPSWLITGAWPLDDEQAGVFEALVGKRLAQHLALQVGDSLVLENSGRTIKLRVAGLVTSGGPEDHLVIAPLASAQWLANEPGAVRQILVAAITKPEDAFAQMDPRRLSPADLERWQCSPYAVSIASDIETAIPGSVAAPLRPVAESEGALLSKLGLLMLTITLVALAASALAISSVMTAAVLERQQEVALMKAIGAPDRSIGGLFLLEAAGLGLGGGVLGFIFGAMLAHAISQHILGYAAQWKPALAPLILLLAGVIVALGSLNAVRRALQLDPALLLHGGAR